MFYNSFLCQMDGISYFPTFVRHQGLQMSSVLAIATSDLFCCCYMRFQLDILQCLCFDCSGYSESVKGKIVFQRVRTFTHLL